MSAAVTVEELAHTYPAKRKQAARQSLKGVSFSADEGKTFGLLGPNGGGKTTLFKILSTFFPPTSGRAEVFGLDVTLAASKIRPRIGVVFQNPSLDGKLTVRENMTHQGHLYGLSGAALSKRIAEMLEVYKLSERADDLAGGLSGGLKRRVDLAKGLLHRPELLLLDEPSTGLDPGARKALWDHIGELKKEGKTILVTTHLMEEADKCDRLVLLDSGKIAAAGTPDSLKAEIGGDVISIQSGDLPLLAKGLKERFQVTPVELDGTLRLEQKAGHTFIPRLVEAFPGLVTSVSVSKPSLEDVFVHHTGRRFLSAAEGLR